MHSKLTNEQSYMYLLQPCTIDFYMPHPFLSIQFKRLLKGPCLFDTVKFMILSLICLWKFAMMFVFSLLKGESMSYHSAVKDDETRLDVVSGNFTSMSLL